MPFFPCRQANTDLGSPITSSNTPINLMVLLNTTMSLQVAYSILITIFNIFQASLHFLHSPRNSCGCYVIATTPQSIPELEHCDVAGLVAAVQLLIQRLELLPHRIHIDCTWLKLRGVRCRAQSRWRGTTRRVWHLWPEYIWCSSAKFAMLTWVYPWGIQDSLPIYSHCNRNKMIFHGNWRFS